MSGRQQDTDPNVPSRVLRAAQGDGVAGLGPSSGDLGLPLDGAGAR